MVRIPHFASIAVIPAKKAEPTAKRSHIRFTSEMTLNVNNDIPFVRGTGYLCLMAYQWRCGMFGVKGLIGQTSKAAEKSIGVTFIKPADDLLPEKRKHFGMDDGRERADGGFRYRRNKTRPLFFLMGDKAGIEG